VAWVSWEKATTDEDMEGWCYGRTTVGVC